MTPELQAQIAEWREKIANNTMTLEEKREVIRYLRAERGKPPEAKPSKPPKAAASALDTTKLLSDLFGIKKET